MKKNKHIFMIYILIILICMVIFQIGFMRIFLSDYKGTVEHDEIMNTHSFSIDQDIILSLWKDYSKSLPPFMTLQQYNETNNYKKLEEEFIPILQLYDPNPLINLDKLLLSMQISKQDGQTIYLKDYPYQNIQSDSYLLNYISSIKAHQEFLFFHIDVKHKKRPTQKQKQNAVKLFNDLNNINNKNLDFGDVAYRKSENEITLPFSNIKTMVQKTILWSQSKYLLDISFESENLFKQHYTLMEYKDELLLVFQPSLQDEMTISETGNTNLILFYDISNEKFSGFLLRK